MCAKNKVLSILQTEKYVIANEVRGQRVWEWQCDVISFDPFLSLAVRAFTTVCGSGFFFQCGWWLKRRSTRQSDLSVVGSYLGSGIPLSEYDTCLQV